ncbi:prolactin-releasing peptide isoform X3 [Anguilla rostrata]|uniref:prolactin-releasing peptide isoform X3 n=1 Tax=Anguilla rostrata TaxID=7938 RepID=UPI0030CF46F4
MLEELDLAGKAGVLSLSHSVYSLSMASRYTVTDVCIFQVCCIPLCPLIDSPRPPTSTPTHSPLPLSSRHESLGLSVYPHAADVPGAVQIAWQVPTAVHGDPDIDASWYTGRGIRPLGRFGRQEAGVNRGAKHPIRRLCIPITAEDDSNDN